MFYLQVVFVHFVMVLHPVADIPFVRIKRYVQSRIRIERMYNILPISSWCCGCTGSVKATVVEQRLSFRISWCVLFTKVSTSNAAGGGYM